MNVRKNAREICHTLCATMQDLCVYAKTEIVRTSDLQNTGQLSTSDLQNTGSPSAKLWNKTTHQSAAALPTSKADNAGSIEEFFNLRVFIKE